MSFLNITAASPSNAELISLRSKRETEDDNRVPLLSHRYAASSAPWPWVDLDDGMCGKGFKYLNANNKVKISTQHS